MEIYERKTHFYVVYICKSPNFEDRGGESSPPLILYMEIEEAPEEKLEDFKGYSYL